MQSFPRPEISSKLLNLKAAKTVLRFNWARNHLKKSTTDSQNHQPCHTINTKQTSWTFSTQIDKLTHQDVKGAPRFTRFAPTNGTTPIYQEVLHPDVTIIWRNTTTCPLFHSGALTCVVFFFLLRHLLTSSVTSVTLWSARPHGKHLSYPSVGIIMCDTCASYSS